MIFYLASRWGRKNEMAQMTHYLRIWNQQVVSHWVDEPKMDQEDGKYAEDWHPDEEAARMVATRDLLAISGATHFVLFTDRSRAGITGGRHVEFGYAYAMGLKTIVVGPLTNPFHYLADYHFLDTHEFMDWVREQTLDGQKMEKA